MLSDEAEPPAADSSSPPPTLSLFSLPEPPGIQTPPRLTTKASVPFSWEEAPGKPFPYLNTNRSLEIPFDPETQKSLELPPRLLQNNLLSPTTVLDGPYLGKVLSSTLSFTIPEKGGGGGYFGSKRWGSFRKSTTTKEEIVAGGGGFDFLADVIDGAAGDYGGGSATVEEEFGRHRRKGSLSISSSSSKARSHFLVNMYESFKQAVPWRRRQR